jgi:hypothetical protein
MTEHELIDLDEIARVLRSREGSARPRIRPRNHRLPQVLAASLLVALFAVGAGVLLRRSDSQRLGTSVSAACASVVEWKGVTYRGASPRQRLTLGDELGHGIVPACNDSVVNGKPTGDSQPTELKLARVVGIPERQAVASADGLTLYVSPGYFPQLPGTVLHDVVFGTDPNTPDERAGDCTRTTDARATVRSAGFGVLDVETENADAIPAKTPIFTDARTEISGGGSPPHVDVGDVVQARVLVCRKSDDPHFLKLVASRLVIEPR